MKKNTHFCIDLKTVMQEDGFPTEGRTYRGALTRDAFDHYLFEEEVHAPRRPARLNSKLYDGRYVSLVHMRNGRYQLHCRTIEAPAVGNRDELAFKIYVELVQALHFIN